LGSRKRQKEAAWLLIKKKVNHLKSISRKAHRLINEALKKVITSHSDMRGNIKFNDMSLPYTPLDLYNHLNDCFTNIPEYEMTWKNYGSYWCIDHIVPQSAFGYDSFEERSFDLCWSLNNLQPLPLTINAKKGAKVFQHNIPSVNRTKEQTEMINKRVSIIMDPDIRRRLVAKYLPESLIRKHMITVDGIPKRLFDPWNSRYINPD